MGFWSNLAQGAKTIAKGTGNHVLKPVGKSMVNTVANPTSAVGNVAKATKIAALPAAGGYLAWQNLANDKSVLESVKDVAIGEDKSLVEAASDVAIGEKNTERIAGAIDSVANVADKASETFDTVNGAANSMNEGGGLNGISNFFKGISSGDGILGTVANLFGNIFKGNVSGMSMFGLAAAAFLTFGRFGWMAKLAGAMLGMMLIGNNSHVSQSASSSANQLSQNNQQPEESQSRGMHR